jgi:hypothetical protein
MGLLASGTFPLHNICYLLFLDIVEWFSCDSTTHMRQYLRQQINHVIDLNRFWIALGYFFPWRTTYFHLNFIILKVISFILGTFRSLKKILTGVLLYWSIQLLFVRFLIKKPLSFGKLDIGYFMENSSALCPGSATLDRFKMERRRDVFLIR